MDRVQYVTDSQVVERAKAAVKLAIEKKKVTDTPVVAYDRMTKTIYRINPDGTRVAVSKRSTRGRYSERNKK